MKRTILLLMSILAILSACSTESSLQVMKTESGITNDEKTVGFTTLKYGELAGKKLVPTTLYYTFSIKNNGNEELNVGDLQIEIEPNEKLLTAAVTTMHFNFFKPSQTDELGLGYGYSFPDTIGPKETKEFTVFYYLGFEEESEAIRTAPSKEQLDELKDNAFDATLTVLLDGKEAANLSLSENK